jgi:hypothetical protein
LTAADDRISLPLGFDVPDGWVPVDPEKAGAPGAAFVAVRPDTSGSFTPNITVGVRHRPDSATILEIADEAVERLGRSMAALDVLSRQEVGEPPEEGVAQVLRLVPPDGRELVQSQVHLTVAGAHGRQDRVVVEIACTTTPDQAASVVQEFQRFVSSFHVRPGMISVGEQGENP